jgi:hypothetical protein
MKKDSQNGAREAGAARLTLMARLANTCRPSALTRSSVSDSTHLKRPSGDPNYQIVTLFEIRLQPFLLTDCVGYNYLALEHFVNIAECRPFSSIKFRKHTNGRES